VNYIDLIDLIRFNFRSFLGTVTVIITAQNARRLINGPRSTARAAPSERQPADRGPRQHAYRRADFLASATCGGGNDHPPTGAWRVAVSREQEIAARDTNTRAGTRQNRLQILQLPE